MARRWCCALCDLPVLVKGVMVAAWGSRLQGMWTKGHRCACRSRGHGLCAQRGPWSAVVPGWERSWEEVPARSSHHPFLGRGHTLQHVTTVSEAKSGSRSGACASHFAPCRGQAIRGNVTVHQRGTRFVVNPPKVPVATHRISSTAILGPRGPFFGLHDSHERLGTGGAGAPRKGIFIQAVALRNATGEGIISWCGLQPVPVGAVAVAYPSHLPGAVNLPKTVARAAPAVP